MGKQPAQHKKAKPAATTLRADLVDWYHQNKRELPWRQSRDAYRIWISEVMLQQTTTQAVIPYYEKFLTRFPKLNDLAAAPESEVLKYWAGLGYYSRARNLHKAAKRLNETGFPKTAAELIEYPGFGPYTSRAVSSLAFDEPVGVLDGNVIRILSRVDGKAYEWWNKQDRQTLQERADELVQAVVLKPKSLAEKDKLPLGTKAKESIGTKSKSSATTISKTSTKLKNSSPALTDDFAPVNQAMMELGATICTPKSPSCFICPWQKSCVALKTGQVDELPLKKPKGDSHILLWSPNVQRKGNKLAFVSNNYAPFLKGAKIFPGTISTLSKRPEKFDYKHTITKYEIYIKLQKKDAVSRVADELFWIDLDRITEEIPYSLITKALKHLKLLT